MSQSVTPHEFRKVSDNDTVCGEDLHAHDAMTEHQDTTPHQSGEPSPQDDTATQPEVAATQQEVAEPQQDGAAPQQDAGDHDQQVVTEPVSTGIMAQTGTGRAMKYRNPWLVWLVWPLITLGIYHFVWYYKIHREMADYQPKRNIPVVGPVLVLI